MARFKQHLSFAALGIKAFLSLEAAVSRLDHQARRVRARGAKQNRAVGRRRPPGADGGTAQPPPVAGAGALDPGNIVWIFGPDRSRIGFLSSLMGGLAAQAQWREPGVGELFGHHYYGLRNRRGKNPRFVMGLDREGWLAAVRNFVLDSATTAVPDLKDSEYLIIGESNGSIGAPLLMEAMPESRLVLLTGGPREVVGTPQREGQHHGDRKGTQRGRAARNHSQRMSRAREAYDAHDGPKVLVNYEKLRSDTLAEMKRIYSTLNIPFVEAELERVIQEDSTTSGSKRRGNAKRQRLVIEVTEPMPDVVASLSAERLQCFIEVEGEPIGRLDLPIYDGLVPAYVIADAVAAEFAWQIVGRFFKRTLYDTLTVRHEVAGLSLWRGGVRLTEALALDEPSLRKQAHDRAGWMIFLQEIWGYPDWPLSRFYDAEAFRGSGPRQSPGDGWVSVEASDDLPELEVAGEEINALFLVGGTAIGAVTIPAARGIVYAHQLRVALTVASGFELCRAVVREALLGSPLAGETSLRTRLDTARKEGSVRGISALGVSDGYSLAPGATLGFDPKELARERLLVVGRRTQEPIGTSASRRAMLPASAREDVLESVDRAHDLVIETYQQGESPDHVIYAPELIRRSATPTREELPHGRRAEIPPDEGGAPLYGRYYFESLFARRVDPWRYTSSYEHRKYEQTLSLIPEEGTTRALELGCAEGHFTELLASRVPSLVATDISQIALDRTARRLEGRENVRFVRLDFSSEPLPGRYDLIVCSEVLYYLEGREQLQAVTRKLVDALEPGGYLVTAHTNQVVDDPERPGFDWGHSFGARSISDTMSAAPELCLKREIRTPLYRIQLFRREASSTPYRPEKEPEIIEASYHEPLPPEIASQVIWGGDRIATSRRAQGVVTSRLPILMYHSVSASGPSALARYRVTPAAFEEQLQYLRESGFRSATLQEWGLAMGARRPLPGRAVIITFDDGYRDFLTEAWPLLDKYDFSATVFLVAGRVGGTNEWDRQYGEEIPLLAWDEIRGLQGEGIEFGAHSVTHRALRSLSIEEVAREALRSRTTLERNLDTHIRSFAYPYGASDGAIHHVVGACGYTFGLTCRPGPSRLHDSQLALPRIEIEGGDGLKEFASKVAGVG